MKLKRALFTIFTLTLLSFGGWFTIIYYIDPFKSSVSTFILLYVSIFFFTMGILTFIGFWLRVLLSNKEVVYAHFTPSLRQSILIAFALTGLLFLQSLRVLSAVDAGAFILAILLLELFFRGTRKPSTTTDEEEL
jgi:predicted MFS family arabinose efflux permease